MPPFEVLKSEKNRDVLLVDGFLFWFDRATPRGRRYWKCIYCYRGHDGDAKNKCLSRVITSPGEPEAIVCKGHNHSRDTVLVEHMKEFGSIRRLASSLRSPSRRSRAAADRTEEPSTSEPLDLSLSGADGKRKSKKALTDVLSAIYSKLHEPYPTAAAAVTPPLTTLPLFPAAAPATFSASSFPWRVQPLCCWALAMNMLATTPPSGQGVHFE